MTIEKLCERTVDAPGTIAPSEARVLARVVQIQTERLVTAHRLIVLGSVRSQARFAHEEERLLKLDIRLAADLKALEESL
jgi:hypothetical protein